MHDVTLNKLYHKNDSNDSNNKPKRNNNQMFILIAINLIRIQHNRHKNNKMTKLWKTNRITVADEIVEHWLEWAIPIR